MTLFELSKKRLPKDAKKIFEAIYIKSLEYEDFKKDIPVYGGPEEMEKSKIYVGGKR